MNYNNVPPEMRLFPQWCVWRYEDTEGPKPTKVPYSPRTNRLASVTDPSTWSTFDEAVHAATSNGWYSGIGFILSENDPYSFIDLDDTKGDATALDRQLKVYNEFPSYAEKSPSGNGLHIIVRGKVPTGRRRSFIEIYSKERYMTMTGDVYRDAPITDCNETLNVLWSQMANGSVATQIYAGLAEAKESDWDVYNRAINAANGGKFKELYEGRWQGMYQSQSEADFALVDIIAFYSQNRAQIARLFRSSALGQREKAQRADYVNYMLNKCFDRMLPPVDIDGLRIAISEAVEAAKGRSRAKEQPEPAAPTAPVSNGPYTAPPGLLGKLAHFIYEAAPRPVPEIALAGAIGFLSGIVGRAYNVSGTGLNQYVLLLAPTGTGKEAIASGIDKLMNAVIRTVPAAAEFVGPAEISSAQALTKYMSKTSCSFVSVVGEFGLALSQMSSEHAPPHLLGLRRMMLDLYNKSGEGKLLRPTIYSDKEKNTLSVLSPSFTLLGESTPERFYECLNESMISEGLLPRFTVIEYTGPRPELNRAHTKVQPSFELVEQLATLCAHALNLNNQHKAIHVQTDANAQKLFDQFDAHCDANINTSEREIRRHLWNRAHIKAMKLASVVAIGINPYEPVIDEHCAAWAMNIVVADVRNLLARFDAGEIGVDNDETRQLSKLVAAVKEYVLRPWSELEKYKTGTPYLHAEKIIPYSFIHKRLAALGEFKKDKMGASNAIKRALKTLTERGDIQEVSKATLMTKYATSATCYMVATPRAFGL